MATMLSYILTDAKVIFPTLDKALRLAVDRFVSIPITVDGRYVELDDPVAVLANGASGITPFTRSLQPLMTD
jgi:N-acetylglutamate synthase/N-acetylornithine aminotransferase